MQEELKEIVTDEIELSYRSDEINCNTNAKELRQIVSDIKQVMRKRGLKYLSAPAIGYRRRIFCIEFADLEIKTFINPVIITTAGLQLSKETSPTLPDKEFIIPRNTSVKAIYQTPTGKTNTREFKGLASFIFQQMCNDLDGISLLDLGLEVDEDYEAATEEEKQQIIEMYLDSLDLKHERLEEEISSDEDLKQMRDAVKFIQSVQAGETVLATKEEE